MAVTANEIALAMHTVFAGAKDGVRIAVVQTACLEQLNAVPHASAPIDRPNVAHRAAAAAGTCSCPLDSHERTDFYA